jgi:polar amino acid transport system permease protein
MTKAGGGGNGGDASPSPGGGAAPDQRAIATMTRESRPHVVRNSVAVVTVLFAIFVLQGLARNKALDWGTIWHYMFATTVLQGIQRTLEITVLSMGLAIILAVVLANMRLSPNKVFRGISGAYVWFFRSIPLLVLLILSFNFSVLYSELSVGVPFGPAWWKFSTVTAIDAFWAAVFAFGFQQAAYTSEVIRAALLAVPSGQREAASALGMTRARTLRSIVLPQAMRLAVPPISNDTINLLKATALVAFISVPDLLYSVQQIYNLNYEVVPLLMVATIWYMFFVTVLSIGQHFLEKKLLRGRGKPNRRLAIADAEDHVGAVPL